jgi:hypothetical protein
VTLNPVRYAPVWMFCAAIFCAVPLLAHQPSTPVTAVVLPDGHYSKLALREMDREASHILKQSGVSLRLRVGAPPQAVSGLLVVVKLRGRCDMDGSPAYLVRGPLGWAHLVDGVILPFSDLDCKNLRGAVQSAISDGNQQRGNVLLGRAMGRVLAHELYHIVGATAVHGRDGVTQAALSPRELTSGQLELGPTDISAVENGLARDR